ncbi:hypothetical protein Tco_0424896 [Tanacetum coccineum]
MAEQDIPPPIITVMKILIIRKGEYDIWIMRMRQYICHTDHNLWDVIVNEDLQEEHAPTTGETPASPAPKTAKQLAARRNQERVKSILLLAIPDEYLLKFHNVADAKSLWEAIKSYLDKAYDRFQKLISQLEVHGAPISKEDINQKVYEDELKRSSGSNSASQNLAFLSSKNTGSSNEVSIVSRDFGISTASGINQVPSTLSGYINCQSKEVQSEDRKEYGLQRKNDLSNAPTTESSSQALMAQDGLGGYDWSNNFEVKPVNYALMAISSSSLSSSFDSEVQKCSKQCLESFKTLQKNYDTEREKHNKAKLEIRGYEIALELLEARILGHEKNELAWGEKYEFQNYELNCREIKINNLNLELEKVVKERDELKDKITKWEESSKNLDEILDSQMSARDKTVFFDGRSSDEESTPANDRSSKADGYKVVPPPIIGNFLTLRADISFAGLDEYAIRNKIIESQTTELNTKTSETVGKTNDANTEKPKSVSESVVSNPKINRDGVIIEGWNSNDEEEGYEVQTVRPETQTVKTRDDKSGQTS